MPAAVLLAALALQASDATLADLEQAYDQTCNGRIYGQYDGMCSDMAARLKSYRAELKHRPKPPSAPPPSAAPSAAATASPSPPASHEPLAPTAPKG